MNAHEVMDVNSRTMPKGGSKPEMRRMTWEPGEKGGHVFRHEMESKEGRYHEPEMHVFGESEGKQALAHFAEHAGLSEHMKTDGDGEEA